MTFLCIAFVAVLTLLMDSTMTDENIQMTCIDDTNKYCKDKFTGFWFIDGCTNCICTSNGARCSKGSCKYTIKNDDEAFDYCEKVMAKNTKLFAIGIKQRSNRQKHKQQKTGTSSQTHHIPRNYKTKPKFQKRTNVPRKRQYSNRRQNVLNYLRNERINKVERRKRKKTHNSHQSKRFVRKHDHKKMKMLLYVREKAREMNRSKVRRLNRQKDTKNKSPPHKRKQRIQKKKRFITKTKLMHLLKKIVTKHNKSIKYLKKMVLRNHNLIQMLKLRLIKMSRYSGLLIVLQREVADLMITNEKMKLKMKWMKRHTKGVQQKMIKFHKGSSRKLKKRFLRLFVNEKRRKEFLRKLEGLKHERKKFSEDFKYYNKRLNHPFKHK